MKNYLTTVQLLLVVVGLYIIYKVYDSIFNGKSAGIVQPIADVARSIFGKKQISMSESQIIQDTFKKYSPLIKTWANFYQVPAQRLMSIKYTESGGGNSPIIGAKGEVGIMQLSVLNDGALNAWKQYVGENEYASQFSASNGFQKDENNIQVACWYFSTLMVKYVQLDIATGRYNGNTSTYADLVKSNEQKFLQLGLKF